MTRTTPAPTTTPTDNATDNGVNVLALVKGDERFVFLYDDAEASRNQTLQTIGRFAVNPELNFNWHDAALLAQKIRHKWQQEGKGESS